VSPPETLPGDAAVPEDLPVSQAAPPVDFAGWAAPATTTLAPIYPVLGALSDIAELYEITSAR